MEKRVDIIVGGTDAGATVTFARVGAEAKKLAGIERSLADARREYLTNEAAAGEVSAQFELKRLAVARDYAAQRERISAIMAAESANDQQKIVAAELLAKLAEQEAAALERVAQARAAALAGPALDDHVQRMREEKEFRAFLAAEAADAPKLDDHVQRMRDERAFRAFLAAEAPQLDDHVAAFRASKSRRTETGPSLKSLLGEESDLGMLLKGLRGAGALAAVGMGASMLQQLTGAAEKFATDVRTGQKAAGEAFDEFMRGVPIVGNIGASLESISELIHGDKAALAAARLEAESLDKTFAAVRSTSKETTRIHEDMLDTIRQIRRESELLQLPPGQRAGAQLRQERDEAARQINKGADDKVKLLKEESESAKRLDALRKERDDLIIPDPVFRRVGDGPDEREYVANSAEIAEAKRRRAEKQAEIAPLESAQKQQVDAIETGRREALAANARKAELEEADRLRQQGEREEAAAREAGQRVVDARNDARAQDLRDRERYYEADRLVAQQALDRELEDIRRRQQEAEKLGESSRETIERRAAAEREAAQQRFDAANKAADTADAARALDRQREEQDLAAASEQRQREADDFLRGQRLANAEQEAAAGRMSKADLERLRIAEQYLERRKQITDEMAKEGLTLEQRAELMRHLQALGPAEAEAKRRAGGLGAGAQFAGALETRAGGAYFGARDQVSREIAEPPEVKATKEQTKEFLEFLRGPFAKVIKDTAAAAAQAALAGIGVASGGGSSGSSGNVPTAP